MSKINNDWKEILEEEFKKEIIESIKKEIKRINKQLKELGVEM